METSDKELLRQGRHLEALGENYNAKPIYLMIFENGDCVEHLDVSFYDIKEAKEWIDKNKHKKKDSQEYFFGYRNSEWL